VRVRLFAGDDWAEDHHDVEVMDEAGKVLARRRLPEGGRHGQLHAQAGGLLGEEADDSQVLAGIETDHGPRVMALAAAGYRVFPVNPQQPARFRARHAVPGGKSDAGDAHVLADMVRTGSHQLREAVSDSPEAAGHQGPRAHAQDDDLGADPRGAAASAPAWSTSPLPWQNLPQAPAAA
jgi:hypothetical protein